MIAARSRNSPLLAPRPRIVPWLTCSLTALVLVEVIALGLSFASSAWLVKESVVLPVEYGGDGNITASFSCGPFSYCLTNIQGGNSRTALNAKAPDVLLTVGAAEFCITCVAP